MSPTTEEQIHEQVPRSYARAVTAPVPQHSCCGGPAPKGVIVKLAGYTSAQLSDLPAEAVINSFGCGNPLAFSEVRCGDVVLDLGSGAGIDLLIAAKIVGPTGRVIGVDMTDEMIARARENIAAAGLSNVEVRKGFIERLPVESSSVDWVISNCVINLSPDKPRVFAEIARVLRPGGRMSVSDVVAQDLPEAVRDNEALYSSCIAGAISEPEYLAGLSSAGLVETEVRERITYDESEMRGFLVSELPDNDGRACCGGATGVDADRLAPLLMSRIWSIKVFARKPED